MKYIFFTLYGVLLLMVITTGIAAFMQSASNFKYCFYLFLLSSPYTIFLIQKAGQKNAKDYKGLLSFIGLAIIIMGIVVFYNLDIMKIRLADETGLSSDLIKLIIFFTGGISGILSFFFIKKSI